MVTRLSSQIVDLDALTTEERRLLLEKLYPTHCRVFAGDEWSDFEARVIKPAAFRTRLLILKDKASHQPVGYTGVYFFKVDFKGESRTVVSTPMVIEREHRGSASFAKWIAQEGLSYKVAHPFEKLYIANCIVHPSSYIFMSRGMGRVYPHWELSTSSDTVEFMGLIADTFGYPPVDPKDPLIRLYPDSVDDSEEEKERWEQSQRPEVAFFRERNPGYASGHGLMVAGPLDFINSLRSLLRIGSHQMKIVWRKMTKEKPKKRTPGAAAS